MVLSSQNSGKYMNRRVERERQRALRTRTGYTTEQLSYMDISGSEGLGRYNTIHYEVESVPVSPQNPLFARERKKLDIRTETNMITGD